MHRLIRWALVPFVCVLTACPGTSDSTDKPSASPSTAPTVPASTAVAPTAHPTPKESIHIPKMTWQGTAGKKATDSYMMACMKRFKTPADHYCQCSLNGLIKMFPNPEKYLALGGKLNEDQEQKIIEPCLSLMPEEKDQP